MTNIEADSLVPGGRTYYSYDRRKRLQSRTTPYCTRCEKWVSVQSRMLGIALDESLFPEFQDSAIVRSLRDSDWSVLDTAEPIRDWAKQPSVFLSLGRCGTCDGPFVVYCNVHGFAHGTGYLGTIFTIEVDSASGVELLERAIERFLMASDARYAEAVEYCKALGSSTDFDRLALLREAHRCGQQGWTYLEKGKVNKATVQLERALRISEELGDRELQAMAKRDLGHVAYDRGDRARAEALYTEALALFEELHIEPEMALLCGCLGEARLERGEPDRGEPLFRKALGIHTSLANKPGMATDYQALGRVYNARREPARAREAYGEALRLSNELGDSTRTAQLEAELAEVDR